MEQKALEQLCNEALIAKGINNDKHQRRLAEEMREVDAKNKHEYFLNLYSKKVRYPKNPHNLLIPYLLGLVDSVNLEATPEYEYGESPDIDIDYLPIIRDPIKQWAFEKFGHDKVCNIGSYNTFGIKSALIDMARVFDKDRHEVLDLTTQLSLKDDEGKPLTWDKAQELYPDLKKYCETNPDVADAAKRLLNRNRGMGKHAGGLIISSVPIDRFVPLVRDKDGTPLSAWVEGLHGQDLGPMGLIKFDLLVITNLMQIALAVKMVKERYKLDSFCALPGQEDWSDLSWLNDPKAIAMADRAELRCVFQFDSDGIRKMVKEGGVTNFEDLVAYTALYRPGPLGMKMHEHFIARKRGSEPYELHPLIKPILDVTYGVLVYQEQVLKILNVVGDIHLKDCEAIRKAISKKKEELFIKYKEMFLVNGQKNLGWTLEQVQNLWDQIAAFAEYGFNRSHACAYTYISAMLLYIKAHYPIEFFAAILSCEDQAEKLKEYKIESEAHGVAVCPLDINRSGVKFKIVDGGEQNMDAIYIGFANVKGIGEAVGERLVAGQPYKNFKDFLDRFGTDAGPIKALLGLRAFKDGPPLMLYKYAEWYKDVKKKREDRRKRFEASCDKTANEIMTLMPLDCSWDTIHLTYEGASVDLVRGYIAKWQKEQNRLTEEQLLEINKLLTKYQKSCVLFQKKVEADQTDSIPFDPADIKVDETLETLYKSIEESEKAFYGFIWTHPLEKSPDYDHRTFERFRNEARPKGYVQVRILEATQTTSKNKKTVYYLLKTEDAHGEIGYVQVWQDDWVRFEDDIVPGALLSMELQAPSGGFKRYTLHGPKRHLRHTLPKSRDYDFRVIKMG